MRLLVFVSVLVAISSAASVNDEIEVAVEERPQKNWFYRTFDSIEDSFRGKLVSIHTRETSINLAADMINKIEKGFVHSVEVKNVNGTEGDDGLFTNRTQEVIELNGQKYMKTKIVEQKKTNTSSVSRDKYCFCQVFD